jgi:hypothetical protein
VVTGTLGKRLDGHAVHTGSSLVGRDPWPCQTHVVPGENLLQKIGLCASMRPRRRLRPLDSPVRGLRRGSWIGGESHPTGAGLPALAKALLCPLLTPPPSTRRFPVVPLLVSEVLGVEVSPEKNANCNCATSACTPEPAPGASVCGATLPGSLA